MPYIKQNQRAFFNEQLDAMVPASNPGELNYIFTVIINRYLANKDEKYQYYNDVLGALEGAKLELYRRKIAPYENIKIEENGDVK